MKKLKVGFARMAVYTMFILFIGLAVGRLTANTEKIPQPAPVAMSEANIVTFLPAVDQDGNGVVGTLETTVKPGSGLVLVNVNSLLAQFDTQLSGRTAAQAAANFTMLDLGRYDIVYNIRVNATVIEGPSAGAGLALSIVAALQNKTLDNRTMITGTISSDGAIGPVGAIAEKAQAARQSGAARFMVPDGQSTEKKITRDRQCSNIDSVRYCEIKYVTKTVNIGESIGIEIIEVRDLEEAMKYFVV